MAKAKCQKMCPEPEIEFRAKNHLIHHLEATTSSASGPRSKFVPDPLKMVKEYTRSAADTHKSNKPELLRPFSVLNQTVDYLLNIYEMHKAINSSHFAMVFSFVSDRLRSVRQDMIMQRLGSEKSMILLEKMLPFYIETDGICKQFKCCTYDTKLHDMQLEECFVRWKDEAKITNKFSESIAICFFFHQLPRKSTLHHDLLISRSQFSTPVYNLIQSIISSFYSNNFVHFFRIFVKLDRFLQFSLVDAVFILRKTAIRIISIGFKSPVSKLHVNILSKWLGFEDVKNCCRFLEFYGISYCTTDEDLIKIIDIKMPTDENCENLRFIGSIF